MSGGSHIKLWLCEGFTDLEFVSSRTRQTPRGHTYRIETRRHQVSGQLYSHSFLTPNR